MKRWMRLPLRWRPQGPFHSGPFHPGLLRFLLTLWFVGASSLLRPATAHGAYVQETPAEDQRTVWDGVYTEGQAERGQVLYTEACSGCHAPDLRGDNRSCPNRS